ncbi:MAG: ammonium transporter [Phormidesmis sp.]
MAVPGSAFAQEITLNRSFDVVGTLWLIIASSLVFFMNAGFAMLETGFCRTRNAVNVLAKNLVVFCVATFAFWLFGFRFMLGDSDSAIIGSVGFLLDFPFPTPNVPNPFPVGFETLANAWEGRSFSALFFFELVFAGTAATIVSGAVAERIKFWAFILFSFVLVGFIYPLAGYWIWGGGWLSTYPVQFRDFAGSTVVHSVGGIAALIGALLLGPRHGKFGYSALSNTATEKEDPERFQPYSLSLATLGCLILWLGWFGFNGGSTVSLEYIPHILTTTFFAAAAGGLGAIVFSPFATDQKARLSSIINGILGGLVGITASSAYVSIGIAIIIGAVSSLLVLVTAKRLAYWKIDDPVGAVPVHLVCGGWGTLAVGLFASPSSSEYQIENYHRVTQVLYQLFGWLSVSLVVGLLSLLAWLAIGIALYFSMPSHERIRQQPRAKGQTADTVSGQPNVQSTLWVADWLYICRQGLRIPVASEEQGQEPSLMA